MRLTGRLYVSTIRRLCCIDFATEKILWDVTPDGGCDRQTISPDGKMLYVPSFEGPHWTVIDAMSGATITKLAMNSRAHNTLFSLDGAEVYLAGLASPMLSVADPRTHTVVRTVGPFGASIRPFTVNGSRTLAYVNVNELLGFEIGDLRTGQKLHRVEVQGYKVRSGRAARLSQPRRGTHAGRTRSLGQRWPQQRDARLRQHRHAAEAGRDDQVRDQPGWVTFSMDGRHAYPSTGEVFDVQTRQRIAALDDEEGRQIGSEKLVEVIRDGQKTVRVGDQFGIGMKKIGRVGFTVYVKTHPTYFFSSRSTVAGHVSLAASWRPSFAHALSVARAVHHAPRTRARERAVRAA